MKANRSISFLVVFIQFLATVHALSHTGLSQKSANEPETVFTNPQSITINTTSGVIAPTTASVYPSNITVSGMTGNTTRVAVTLNGLSHFLLNDMDFLLVSPSGAKYIFFSDAASFFGPHLDRVYAFSDDAATTLPNNSFPFSGNYKPSSGDASADTFPAPAPAGPYNQPAAATFASTFNGVSQNGTWSLYAVDDQLQNAGSVNSGWALTITTDGSPATFINNGYMAFNSVSATSTPYGTSINVAGLSGKISNLRVSLNGISHMRPIDVDILLVTPNGQSMVLMSDTGGTTAATNVNLTFDDTAPTGIGSTLVSGTFKPTDINGVTDFFPAPAPLAPYSSSPLSQLNGFSPNGEWRLFVDDGTAGNSGTISGGWSLDITTVPIVPPTPVNCAGASFVTSSFQTGVNPTNVAIADFNNDTKADLAITNQVSNDVSILPGNGDGTFGAQSLIAVGSSPYAIAAGKFNADNNFDLAVVNSGSNNVSILLGNGNGTFASPVNFLTGSSPLSVAVGDFNNDLKQDLVIANFGGFFSGSASVLLGNGNGGFAAGNTLRTRSQPSFVTVANLNGDANTDLIVANFGSDSVSTFFGFGNGTFQLNQNIQTGFGPVAVEIADLDTDGIADLAVANYNGDSITMCNGNAAGSFVSCTINNAAGGSNPISLAAADYAQTGTKTLAAALSGSNLVTVLSANVSVGQNPNAIKTLDLNGDTKPDIVSINSGSNDVSVLINNCLASHGNIFDFDGDRKTDNSVFRAFQASWYVSQLGSSLFAFGRPTDKVVSADFNGDRLADFAIYRPDNGLWFVIDRISNPIYFYQFGTAQDLPVPADYDGDGKADLAVWRPSDGNWYIRRSSDNGFGAVTFGMSGDSPAPADYDGDGKDDIAIFRPSTGIWFIVKSSNGQVTGEQFGTNGDKTVSADYDGDAKADIAVWRPSTGAWYVRNSSNGALQSAFWGNSSDIPLVGDYDGDGRFDFAVFRPSDGTWYVRKSSDGGGIFFPWGISTDTPIPGAFVR